MSEHHIQIVRVASSAKPNGLTGSQKIVAYDLKRRKAMEVPKLNFIMRDFKYYCVDFDESAVRKLERIVIEDRIAEKRAPVDIEYSVRCEKDQEHQLVNALKGSDQPARMIDDHVLKVLRDAALEKADDDKSFLPYFPEWSNELARRIEQALRDIGLKPGRVKVKLHPKPIQDLLPPQSVISTPLRDYGGEVQVTLNHRGEVDPDHETNFLLADDDPKKLEGCIVRWSKAFFSGQVGIARLDTSKAEVEAELLASLNRQLAEFGRKINHLDFQFDFPFKVPPRQCQFDHVVPCPIKDISNLVEVKHAVLVRLVDLGKWVKARGDDPVQALKNAIAEATHSAVFNNTYLQVIKAFNQPQGQGGKTAYNEASERIKVEVKAYAETIGYAVEHLISVPDIQPLILQREGLKCSIDQEFGLQDPRIKGRLLVDIFGQLPDLELIENYLRPGVDLVTEVKTRTIRLLEPKLVKTSPHRFYTEFMVTGDGKKGVAEKLSAEINTFLAEVFQLKDSHISVRMGETELARRAAQLARGQHETTVTFLVGSGEHGEEAQGQFGAEDMSFVIRYAIDGIDGQNTGSWYCFQARDYETPEAEVSAINQVLNDELTILLNQLPVAALRSIEFQGQATQKKIKQRLAQKIVEDFGVVITISAVVRRESKTDAFNRQASDFRVEAVTDQLAQAKKLQAVKMEFFRASYEELFRKRHELAVKDPTDPLLVDYDNRLAEMEKTLQPEASHAAMLATPKAAPKLPSVKPVSILEHLNKLDGGENAAKSIADESDSLNAP